MKRNELISCCIGILIGALFVYLWQQASSRITLDSTEYHTHADFVIYLGDERLNLNDKKYMTTAEQSLHTDVHLHDEIGDVVHFHAPDVPFSEFIASLGHTLTNDCFITSDGTQYCNSERDFLQLYVNDELYSNDISAYVPTDLDQILIFYGPKNDERIAGYLEEVKDEACIYSGSCPERGTAPPESCGLTCEL